MKISVSGFIKAATPIVWVKTDEYDSFLSDVALELSKELSNVKFELWRWDAADALNQLDKNGLSSMHKRQPEKDALAEMKQHQPDFPLRKIVEKKHDSMVRAVYFLLDYHEFIGKIDIWRKLQNLYEFLSANRITIIVVSPKVAIPTEIADYVVVVDYDYPTVEWLKAAAGTIAKQNQAKVVDIDKVVNVGQGLSRVEFRQALYNSIANSKDFNIHWEYVEQAKQARIDKESVIRILPSQAGFEAIVGLDRLKNFTKGMIASGKGRGVLLLGVPGAGKSAFAATLGFETKRTALYLDFATLMGGIVGETEDRTERALRLVDAMQPCILVIDEIEKGLAGTSGYNGDSGTSRRQGSLFLKWLSDHETDVYVVATANSIADLPPEYKRAERWDGIFFVDTPHQNQAKAILKYYAKLYSIKEKLTKIDVTGLTGAEIKSTCRIADSLGIKLDEARQYVKPIADSMDIAGLRRLAHTCAIVADDEFVPDEEESADLVSTGRAIYRPNN
jgi:hypothetical protein